jgi:hypothetical protein
VPAGGIQPFNQLAAVLQLLFGPPPVHTAAAEATPAGKSVERRIETAVDIHDAVRRTVIAVIL